MSKNIKTTLDEFINENNDDNHNAIIVITEQDIDERSPRNKKLKSYDVNYQITINDNLYEITGLLKPYNSGRAVEYEFEPDQFDNIETENYYDKNWETIEEEILNELDNI